MKNFVTNQQFARYLFAVFCQPHCIFAWLYSVVPFDCNLLYCLCTTPSYLQCQTPYPLHVRATVAPIPHDTKCLRATRTKGMKSSRECNNTPIKSASTNVHAHTWFQVEHMVSFLSTILYSICAYNTDICVVSCGIYHGYLPPVDIRGICHGICTGYNADIRVIRHKYYIRGIKARGYPQISVVYNRRILARILAHSP